MNNFAEKQAGYRQLNVWKSGIELVKAIYTITREFPKEEMYGLTSQMRRAAVSIPSNIAEGNSRKNSKEFQQYLFVALGSLSELETQLVITCELDYLKDEKVKFDLMNKMNKIRAMILNLLKRIPARSSWPVVRSTQEVFS